MKVHPGKEREYLALIGEWKALAAKHGLNPRLLVSMLAGPDVGQGRVTPVTRGYKCAGAPSGEWPCSSTADGTVPSSGEQGG